MAAAQVDALVEDQRVALHRHNLGVQVADVDQHRRTVTVLLGQVEHRLARGGGEEVLGLDVHVAQTGGHVIQEEAVADDEGDQRGQLAALETHRFEGLLAVVHAEPGGAGMDDFAGQRLQAQILGSALEDGAHVAGGDMGIRAGQGHAGLGDIHAGEGAGHANIDLADLVMALLFSLGNGLADAVVDLRRIVPAVLQEAVVGHDARAHDVAALGAAVLGHQGHDLARTEIEARYRGLHLESYPLFSGFRSASDIAAHTREPFLMRTACPPYCTKLSGAMTAQSATMQYTTIYYKRFPGRMQAFSGISGNSRAIPHAFPAQSGE